MGYIIKNSARQHRSPAALFDDFFTKDFLGITPDVQLKRTASPAINIKETEKEFQLEVFAPGRKKEDFKLELENNTLTLSVENESETEKQTENGEYTRKEFSFSSFSRSFTLPEEQVNSDDIKATYTDGILYVSLPKKEVEAKKEQKKLISVS